MALERIPIMSHPRDRRERFLIGQHKGEKRARCMVSSLDWVKSPEWVKTTIRRHRNTTKLCGRPCCTNPRNNGWGPELTMQEIKFFESCEKDF